MNNTTIHILQALLTPTIGVVAAYVAWQQYRLAKQKHHIDIFNRRMQVYKTTVAYIVKCERTHTIAEDDFYQWVMDVADAEFLFGEEIIHLLTHIEGTSAEILSIEEMNPPVPMDEDYEVVTFTPEYAELMEQITSFHWRARELFSPYFQTFLKLKELQKKSKYAELLKAEQVAHEKTDRERPVFPSEGDDIPF